MDRNSPQPVAATWMAAIQDGNHRLAWSFMTERYRKERVRTFLDANGHRFDGTDLHRLAEDLSSLKPLDPLWDVFAGLDAASFEIGWQSVDDGWGWLDAVEPDRPDFVLVRLVHATNQIEGDEPVECFTYVMQHLRGTGWLVDGRRHGSTPVLLSA